MFGDVCETKDVELHNLEYIANVHKPIFFLHWPTWQGTNQLLAHFTSVKKSYVYIHIKVIDAMLEAKKKKP